jgi:magnesium chelatase family protein
MVVVAGRAPCVIVGRSVSLLESAAAGLPRRRGGAMFASIPSATLLGADGHAVHVEVTVTSGLPGFHLVGRPDVSIREARERVRAAILNSCCDWPKQKITVNLAPSSDRKAGSSLDLAIAVGVLAASDQVPSESVRGLALVGELGLDGSLRAIPGMAPMVRAVGDRDVVVPICSAVEANVAATGAVRLIEDLAELVAVLRGLLPWPDHEPPAPPCGDERPLPDLADVQGQPLARHALEVAATGGHHTLFIGPPGAGKTMLAARLPGLLPELDRLRSIEATMVHSAAGVALPSGGLIRRPPLRTPHHATSQAALVGGGSHVMRPGEISLAHGGVLFMDELAEFAPAVLDSLRQPLESGRISIERAEIRALLPAEFLLVAAMNPCPCGGGAPGDCVCGEAVLQRYARRVSGPLLDRFDLRVPVQRPAVDDLIVSRPGEPTATVAARVGTARALAIDRQGGLNARLSVRALDEVAGLSAAATALLRDELEHGRLSGRGYHRVRRVARTIADLRGEESPVVAEQDVALALRFRASLTGFAAARSVA